MKLNDSILDVWIKEQSRAILNHIDSQIMWVDNEEDMKDVVFSDDIVDAVLNDLKDTYDCSDYDDFDIVQDLRDVQHDRINKYIEYLNDFSSRFKKPNQKDLANYLGVTEGAVSQYDKTKKELLLFGLWIKNNLSLN